MLDLVFLRDRLDDARARLGARNAAAAEALSECAEIDTRWRLLVTDLERLKSEHNAANAAISQIRKTGTPQEFEAAREAGKVRGDRIKGLEGAADASQPAA